MEEFKTKNKDRLERLFSPTINNDYTSENVNLKLVDKDATGSLPRDEIESLKNLSKNGIKTLEFHQKNKDNNNNNNNN